MENPDGAPDIYDFYEKIKEGNKVLVCLDIDQINAYLFGENNGNDVTFCSAEKIETMLHGEWDVIVISNRFEQSSLINLEHEGYQCYEPYYLEQKVWIK